MHIAETVRRAFWSVQDEYQQAALRDLFALGCHLHAIGKHEAGWKACKTALRVVHHEHTTEILRSLPGNEAVFFRAVAPHAQLLELEKEF